MSKVKFVERKSMLIKPSGRSTDFITPSFGFGCLYNCSYCYCKRHVNNGLSIATNVNQILSAVEDHATELIAGNWRTLNKPNQTDDERITYDIGCNEDLALHAKHHDIHAIYEFFEGTGWIKASFATKYVNYDLPDTHSCSMRIRFSLMPQKYSDILEPNTSLIIDRIGAINDFINKGYEVHINFSPVIVTDTWHTDYSELFTLVDQLVSDENKRVVKAEVIFLTHNEKKHAYNLANNILGEEMLWRPELQENKKSQYGGENIRYKHALKAQYVYEFKALHNLIIPWNTIRYIF
jgi:spore photoproduct lyase